jgi:hypothetical protein
MAGTSKLVNNEFNSHICDIRFSRLKSFLDSSSQILLKFKLLFSSDGIHPISWFDAFP